MKEYWEILRDLREDHDLKQADVAKLLHTTQQVYSRYENGINEMPIRHLRTLCALSGQRRRGAGVEGTQKIAGRKSRNGKKERKIIERKKRSAFARSVFVKVRRRLKSASFRYQPRSTMMGRIMGLRLIFS